MWKRTSFKSESDVVLLYAPHSEHRPYRTQTTITAKIHTEFCFTFVITLFTVFHKNVKSHNFGSKFSLSRKNRWCEWENLPIFSTFKIVKEQLPDEGQQCAVETPSSITKRLS